MKKRHKNVELREGKTLNEWLVNEWRWLRDTSSIATNPQSLRVSCIRNSISNGA